VSDVAVVILAGGEGSRLGGQKPLKVLAGARLIDRALAHARRWSDLVAVAVREAGQLPGIDAERIVDDAHIAGPLGGLIAALRFAAERNREFLLTIAADMPFLPPDLLDRLNAEIADRGCAMAGSAGHLHPVCALWRSSALDRSDAYVESGRRSLKGFAESLGFAEVEWSAGPDPFFNINSPADLAEAERRLAA